MGFFEAMIRALLYLCGLALAFYLVLWVLGAIGLPLPFMVERILGVMFVLIAILILARLFYPWMSKVRLFPPRPPPE
jgi:hypothetical protein